MGKVLTDAQRKIQNDIDKITKEINDFRNAINGHKNQIDLQVRIIDPLEKELDRLRALLNNARDTPNEYDKLKLKIQSKKRELNTCGETIQKIKNDITATDLNTQKLEESFNFLKKKYDILVLNKSKNEAQLILDSVNISNLSVTVGDLEKQFNELQKINQANIISINGLNDRISGLEKTIVLIEQKIYTNVVYNNENLLKKSKNIDSSLNNLFNYLKKQNTSSDVIYEKIEYRDIEHEKLYNTNKLIDILFYCFYFSFILIMICIGNTQREHFLIYLFVGLIPYIYPFVFKFLLYLFKYLSTKVHGPKNAFVDINNTLYAMK
jgi:chromosome segregation ATPase